MRILLLNQCFHPDVMATAQQLTSLAVCLSERGHDVTVITGNRGYDDPTVRFPKHEHWNGIEIQRIPSLALGKTTRWRRALNFFSFLLACTLRLLFSCRFDVVIALTSPPLISVLGALFVQLRGGRFYFWVMDLNPDEAIAAGWLKAGSWSAKLLERMLKYSLRQAEQVIALDRFMRARLCEKGITPERIAVISPWTLNEVTGFDMAGREAFRAEHGLSDKFVVMYSGNHSPCHPLDTLLKAARILENDHNIAFCFVGGGSEQAKVIAFAERHQLANITVLPYQPLDQLAGSLSAGDLHVAVMGEAFVGVIHPSKIYNVLAVGAPLVYIGPEKSSIADVAREIGSVHACYSSRHGDVDSVIVHIRTASRAPFASRDPSIAARFSKDVIVPRLIRLLEERLDTRPEIEAAEKIA
ncbi:MAG TPA: glycosyltransferase family 4 protein [Pyrinomonadaceae bacterium]|nr:glycosyltransferase family 4 protein [Pyrinomonadaceae bacterium]